MMHEFQLMSLYWYNIITQNLGFILGFTFGVVHYMVLGKCIMTYGLPWCSAGKESTCNAGDPDSIPGSGRSPGERIGYPLQYSWASLVGQLVKKSACNVGDLGSISRLGRSSGEGKGHPLQYSGLENSTNCTVHGVTKSQTRLSYFHFTSPRNSPVQM